MWYKIVNCGKTPNAQVKQKVVHFRSRENEMRICTNCVSFFIFAPPKKLNSIRWGGGGFKRTEKGPHECGAVFDLLSWILQEIVLKSSIFYNALKNELNLWCLYKMIRIEIKDIRERNLNIWLLQNIKS